MERIVIVGASLAATSAIDTLRGADFAGEIVLIGAERHLPYDRPPLSKDGLRAPIAIESVWLREPGWYEECGVTIRLGHAATDLDIAHRCVRLADGSEVAYDGLIIATGSTAHSHTSEHDHVLRTIEDSWELHDALATAENVAILGAGFIGLEVASAARSAGRSVSVVELGLAPLSRVLGDEAGAWLDDLHRSHGVDLLYGQVLSDLVVDDGIRMEFASGRSIRADVLVSSVGARPSTGWLRRSGITLSDGVVCDSALQTGAPDVVAAGDVARWHHPLFDESMRIEQWANAVEQGRHAALTLLGHVEPYAEIPFMWTDQFDSRLRFLGRANGADQMHVDDRGDAVVVIFGRQGITTGVMSINAPKDIARHRQAIAERQPWADVVAHSQR